MDSRKRRGSAGHGTIAVPLIALVLLCGAASACSKENPDLARILDLEGKSRADVLPETIEGLQAGIERWSAEAARVVDAEARVGEYWEILAARYLEKGMFLKAYGALVEAIARFPDRGSLYYQAGVAAANAGKSKEVLGAGGAAERAAWYEIAESSYLHVLKMDERNANCLYGLAVLYEFELDRSADAEPLVRRFLGIRTRDVDGWLLLGRVLYGLGRLEEAMAAYDQAAKFARPTDRIGGTSTLKRQAAERNRDRIKEELGAAPGGK